MKEKILEIIFKSGWAVRKDQDNIKMIQIQKGNRKINIYWGTMTIILLNAKSAYYETVRDVDLDQLREYLGVKFNLFQRIRRYFKG